MSVPEDLRRINTAPDIIMHKNNVDSSKFMPSQDNTNSPFTQIAKSQSPNLNSTTNNSPDRKS